jgi:hypothetical protein
MIGQWSPLKAFKIEQPGEIRLAWSSSHALKHQGFSLRLFCGYTVITYRFILRGGLHSVSLIRVPRHRPFIVDLLSWLSLENTREGSHRTIPPIITVIPLGSTIPVMTSGGQDHGKLSRSIESGDKDQAPELAQTIILYHLQ